MANKQSKPSMQSSSVKAKPRELTRKQIGLLKAMTIEFLIGGYLREIEANLDGKIIPKDVSLLCFAYCYSNSTLICVVENHEIAKQYNSKAIYFADDINETKNVNTNNCTNWNYSFSKLNKSTKYFNTHSSFIFGQKNVLLPSSLKMKHDIIFKIGGKYSNKIRTNNGSNRRSINTHSNHCIALIFDENDKTNLYEWILSDLPMLAYINCLIYSIKYGLICVSGIDSKTIYTLSLDKQFNKWELLPNLEPKIYDSPSCGSACCMINEDNLFINGGLRNHYNKAYQTTKLYNMKTKQWIDLKRSKYGTVNSGIFFDKINNKILIGACCGDKWKRSPLNKVQSYDIYKNKWIKLPETSLKHSENALIWKYGSNNMVNIASVGYGMEFIDLREHRKKWNVIYSKWFNDFSKWSKDCQRNLRLLRFNDHKFSALF